MTARIDRLAGPESNRPVFLRAAPILRLASLHPDDIAGLFGDQGEPLAMAAVGHLAHPDLPVLRIVQLFVDLREAAELWVAYDNGAADTDLWPASVPWTSPEIDAEVLGPLSELLTGTPPCKPCLEVATHAGMLHPRLPGEVVCQVHLSTTCCRCARIPANPVRRAQVVVGRRGYCVDCTDRATAELGPGVLSVIDGGRS